jgi:DNA-binding NarL/FixJ family response regulator
VKQRFIILDFRLRILDFQNHKSQITNHKMNGTSLDRESDKRRGIQVGADAYIVKGGFDQSTLLDAVQNLVGRSGP